MSESDDRTAPPRERRGLLGLLRRLFGGGQAGAPAATATATAPPVTAPEPAAEAVSDAGSAAGATSDPRWQRPPDATPARPAAWEGPLPRSELQQMESAQPISADPWENSAESAPEAARAAEPPPVESTPPPVSPVPEPPSAADEEGTLRPTDDQPASAEDTPPIASSAPADGGENAEDASVTVAEEPSEATARTEDAAATAETPEPLAATAAQPPHGAPLADAAESSAPEASAGETQPAAAEANSADAEPVLSERVEPAPATAAAEPAHDASPTPVAGSGDEQQHTAAPAKPLANPLDRARAALEEARRQMPGLMADAAPAAQPAAQPAVEGAGRAYAAEWPGLLEGLRQAREGLAGEINVLRGVVNDLRREVGRLSDVVAGMQHGEGTPPQQAAGLQQTLPRLQAMLDQLRSVSGSMESQAQQPLMSASGAPLAPPVRVQVPRPNGAPPTLPEIVWGAPVPHEHVYVPQPAATPQPAPAPQPAASHTHGPALLLVIAPVEGLAKLSALERRLAASSAVQRLDLGGYRRGEASFRLVLAAGATIHDVIRVAPEPGSTVADVRIEGNLARVQLSPREAAQAATTSPS